MAVSESLLEIAVYIQRTDGFGRGRGDTFVFFASSRPEREQGVEVSNKPVAKGEPVLNALNPTPRTAQVTLLCGEDMTTPDLGAGFTTQGHNGLRTLQEQVDFLDGLSGTEITYSSRTAENFRGVVSKVHVREDEEYVDRVFVEFTITRFIVSRVGGGGLGVTQVLIPNRSFDPAQNERAADLAAQRRAFREADEAASRRSLNKNPNCNKKNPQVSARHGDDNLLERLPVTRNAAKALGFLIYAGKKNAHGLDALAESIGLKTGVRLGLQVATLGTKKALSRSVDDDCYPSGRRSRGVGLPLV